MRTPASVFCLVFVIGAIAAACGTAKERPSAQRIVLEPSGAIAVNDEQLDQSVDVMRRRLEAAGVSGAKVQRQQHQIVVELPRPTTGEAVRLLTRVGRLEFFDLQGDLTGPSLDKFGEPAPSASPMRAQKGQVVLTCGAAERYCPGVPDRPNRTYHYLFKYQPENKAHPIPEMTGADLRLEGIRQDFDPASGQPVVLMQFTKAGARKFLVVTRTLAERGRTRYGAHRGKGDPFNYFQQFAIVLDGEIKSAPTIDFRNDPEGISGDNGAELAGIGSVAEAKEVAVVLQSGALPVGFHVVAE